MFDTETLRNYEDRGLLKSSTGSSGHTVWCYTQQTVVERAWDEVTRSCRGLVTAPDGTLVSRPFTKFYNYSEPEAVIEQGPFVAFDKMDGTLIVVGEHDGEAVVSTKGSFDTWHSEAARDLLLGFVPPAGTTCMFELIHPANRIVIDYGDYEGLVFLGAVDNETGADIGLPDETAEVFGWHGDVVVRRNFDLKRMINTIQDPEAGEGREGFVVAWLKPGAPANRIKLKFDLYVKLHGIYTGLTNRKVWEFICDGTLEDLYTVAPDELHDAITEAAYEVRTAARALYAKASYIGSQAMLEPTRKAAAELIQSQADGKLRGLCFKVYDGKLDDAWVGALKMVRPEESRFVGSAGLS